MKLLYGLSPVLCTAFLALFIPSPSAASSSSASSSSSEELWQEEEGPIPAQPSVVLPARFRLLNLDLPALRVRLSLAPREGSGRTGPILSVPLPGGGFARFRIEESSILAPELAARYPEIRTFRGQGIDDPRATIRLDHTPAGFHGMVLAPSETVFIDPVRDRPGSYITYFKRDFRSPWAGRFPCPVSGELPDLESAPEASSGKLLRTYRVAVAATGEYTSFHGGSVPAGLAAITTAMNRVNGVYERDVAIRMELVANSDLIVYTNPGSDPYTNNNGFSMLSQNQSNLDSVIGSANYDIGHVFSTGGGGVAGLGVVCGSGKAQGVTGLPFPAGDPFYIDYVAHEMGHQWGASHTFNGSAGSCAGNRSSQSAYEPGSGTTIMAYAGICGSQNTQSNSDDHFHVRSFDQIVSYSTSGNGASCGVSAPTGNLPPVVDAGPDFAIPVSTPFTLCGSAIDAADQASLTYAWEQYNLGPAGSPNSPTGDAPIFRSFSPMSSPCRTFPQPSDLENNTQTIGEILPSYARTLTFRLTARDNRAGAGGADYDSADVVVVNTGGAFQVTRPNTGLMWSPGSSEEITWNVAGTDVPPVDCPLVDILFSSDGGATFPTALLEDTANDGTEFVTLPLSGTDTARIQVRCADSIFFDISNVDFSLGEIMFPSGVLPDGLNIPGPPLMVTHAAGGDITLAWGPSCRFDDFDFAIYEGTLGDFTSHVPQSCSTGNVLSTTLTPATGNRYYLVVPRNPTREGGYGFDSSSDPRPASASACASQLSGACDF